MILGLTFMSKVSAKHILGLLAKRHCDDVFIPECKNGPTWRKVSRGQITYRMDAWVLKRSWAQPCTTGYEIKVSRSDFLQDKKWKKYLPLCNKFFFVCPDDTIIRKDELPKYVGLIYLTKDCTSLRAVKRAVYRDVVLPDNLWRYIVMCRSEISNTYSKRRR